MRKLSYILLLIAPFYLMGCKDSQATTDNKAILAYISANHLNATVEANGVYFAPVSGGNGQYASSATLATCNYKGTLTNGAVFDQESSATFNLSQLIPGFAEGIQLMQKGQTAVVLIPSAMGYGPSAQPSQGGSYSAIPANSVLVFTITLVSFQ